MNKVIDIKKAIKIAHKLNQQKKEIVLVGGCFDILHAGHVAFLENAKKQGDILFVILESDGKVKALKGSNRPINTQENRAYVLSSLYFVDYVVYLPMFSDDLEYDQLVEKIKPGIIATTKDDPFRYHKERQAKQTGASVVDVVARITHKSTGRLAKILSEDKIL